MIFNRAERKSYYAGHAALQSVARMSNRCNDYMELDGPGNYDEFIYTKIFGAYKSHGTVSRCRVLRWIRYGLHDPLS